jgi:hypothetical protein
LFQSKENFRYLSYSPDTIPQGLFEISYFMILLRLEGEKIMNFETDVKEAIQRTGDIISIRFARPAEFDYSPGQFITSGARRVTNTPTFRLGMK